MKRFLGLAVLLSGLVSQAAEPRWGLKWSAPDACIGVAELSRLVDTKLGHTAFSSSADYRIDGAAEGKAGAWAARLTLVSAAGDVLGTRELSSAESSCRSLDGKLASVMALMIEAGPPPMPSAPPLAARSGGPSAAPADEEGVPVHIDADTTGVRLMRVAAQSYGMASNGTSVAMTAVVDVCGAPCDKRVLHTESPFYIGGDVVSSESFRLDGMTQGANIKVTTGSKGLFYLGVVLNYVGVLTEVTGVSLLIPALLISSIGSMFLLPAIICMVAGAVMFGVGIPLTIINKTRVDVTPMVGGVRAPMPATAQQERPAEPTKFTLARF